MYVDPARVEPVTELSAHVDGVVADRAPTEPAPIPDGLRVLAADVRSDPADRLARRSLAVALLGRGWSVATATAASGLAEGEVRGLEGVRRPGTAASSVADDLVAARTMER